MLRVVTLALLLLLAAVQVPPLDADTDFAEGKRLYEELEFEQAVFRFQKAALSSQARPAPDRAEVFLWLGLSYAGLGNFEGAKRAFRDGLLLAPDLGLPSRASPKVVELLDEVRAEVKAELSARPPPVDEPLDDPGLAVPEDASEPAADGPPWLLLGAGALGAAGVASMAGAGVLSALVLQNLAVVDDPDAFQDDTKRAAEMANLQIAGGGALLGVGVLLLGGAAGLATVAMTE